MLKLKKIAITGGVASGKSSLCRFFEELGAFVASADAIAHELLDPNTDLGKKIIRQFGPEVLEPILEQESFRKSNGNIQKFQFNRRCIAEKVFKDPQLLKKLEEWIHPAVLKKIEELYDQACKTGSYSSFVVEIPLLYEIGAETFYDVVIAVLADEEIAKARFEKAGFQPMEYEQRMKRQIAPRAKSDKARYTVWNNGSLEDLRQEAIKLNRIIHNL